MNRYISILRGINVGGKRKMPMQELRQLLAEQGFNNIKTYIQSGNVIFDAEKEKSQAELSEIISEAILGKWNFEVPVITFTGGELQQAIAENPFYEDKESDINRLHLTFLSEEPEPELLQKINAVDFAPDAFSISGRHVWLFCAGKYSDSKLSNQFFERKLKTTATTRNWKTVLKLAEMSEKN